MKEKIPADIAQILEESGFNTELSILNIDIETIGHIEGYANENPAILKNTSYENIKLFKFKPGHKAFILQLPTQIQLMKDEKRIETYENHSFSYILKTFIEQAMSNSKKDVRGFRYSETIRYFSTYIYLHCGKACYETLSANLPIPSANSIRKYTKYDQFGLIKCAISLSNIFSELHK